MTTATEPMRTSETIDIAVTAGPTSPGTTADWELFFARRALAKLKSQLGQQALLELLEPDTAASARTLKAWADSSHGQWRPALTQLQVRGISAEDFVLVLHVDHRRPAETPSRATRAFRPGRSQGRPEPRRPGRRESRPLHQRLLHHLHQRKPGRRRTGPRATPPAWRALSRSPTAPPSGTRCTNSVKPRTGSMPCWPSTSPPPRQKNSSRATASISPSNSPTGSAAQPNHSADQQLTSPACRDRNRTLPFLNRANARSCPDSQNGRAASSRPRDPADRNRAVAASSCGTLSAAFEDRIADSGLHASTQ